jgi:hypothetical protein
LPAIVDVCLNLIYISLPRQRTVGIQGNDILSENSAFISSPSTPSTQSIFCVFQISFDSRHIFHISLRSSSSTSRPCLFLFPTFNIKAILMARFSIEIPQRSPSIYRQCQPMGQEGSSLPTQRENDSSRPSERHRRSPVRQHSVSENDESPSGSSDELDEGFSAAEEASPRSRKLKSVAKPRLSSPSVSSEHDSSDESDNDSELAEDPEVPFPSRLSSPINSSRSATSQTLDNERRVETDSKTREVIDLCTPEPETLRQKPVPRTNGPLRRSLSPFFGSHNPIKRERSRSTSPNTPRRRRAFESWEAYKDDIAENYEPPALPAPPAPKYKACARCQAKGMVCDGRERCQRCIWKKASCVYNEKGTEPCLRCRDRRYKCDKEIPCNRCVAGSAKCEYGQEPPKFEEIALAPNIKVEEATLDHVPSAGVSPLDAAVSQDPKKLKRPARDWMDRYRENTETPQSTTRTQQRYPRPPKPLRAKKPLRNARGQRGIQRAPQWPAERDTYDDFEAQIRTPSTKVRVTDLSTWTRLERDELLELSNSNTTFDLDFGQFQHGNTRQSPNSQQWAAFPSPISLGGHLKENTPSQVSARRSSEIAQSTEERKRPLFLCVYHLLSRSPN